MIIRGRTEKDKLEFPILVVGLGVSGKSILRLLRQWYPNAAQIFTLDEKNPAANFATPAQALATQPKTLIVSPGVPLATPWIQQKINEGIKITSELDLAFQALTTEKVVGVSGSVGKSTVTAILGAGLRNFDVHSFAGGNIGVPLADYVYRIEAQSLRPAEWIALELSSYQLENFASLSCDACVLTSLTPNHLERYGDLEDYYDSKLTLLEKTDGPCVLNSSGLDLPSHIKKRLRTISRTLTWTDRNDPLLNQELFAKSQLLGSHNQDNLALCLRLGQLLEWPETFAKGALSFKGLPHRLENFGDHNGILFINDSKATTISSVLQAVESLTDVIQRRESCYLLIGGKDKNLPWSDLQTLRRFPKLKAHFFGEVGYKAQQASGLAGPLSPTLAVALRSLFPILKSGDLVLLSPGGTSLDEFSSFEHRGDFFREEIERWSSGSRPQV